MWSKLINEINDKIIGHACFVQDDEGKLAVCEITRADLYVSSTGTGINLHLKRNGNQNFPHCVNAFGYRNHNVSNLPYGFTSMAAYISYYN